MQFHQILILYRKICLFNSKKIFLLREHIVPLLPGRLKCIISNSLILLTVSSLPLLVYFILSWRQFRNMVDIALAVR